jgi:hypothetical protein
MSAKHDAQFSAVELIHETTLCFRAHRKPNGWKYTDVEVSATLDYALEPSHLGKLRNSTIPNPKRDTLMLLCHFFPVSPDYVFPDLPANSANDVAGGDPIACLRCYRSPSRH